MHLIACPACRRQYDVTNHEPGEAVRCSCGEKFSVAHREPREVKALRCAGCGAAFSDDVEACGFCHRPVAIHERRLTSVCPECWARLPDDAAFCSGCGIAISPQALVPVPRDGRCPRCATNDLCVRDIDRTSLIECARCNGVWLPLAVFEKLIEEAARRRRGTAGIGVKPHQRAAAERHAFRYLLCPACEEPMTPRNFDQTSGILVDLCGRHGVWLDRGELEEVADWTRRHGVDDSTGGLVARSRQKVLDRSIARAATPAPVMRPSNTLLLDVVAGIFEFFIGDD